MEQFLQRYFYPQNVTPQNRIFSPEHLILTGLVVLAIVTIIRAQIKHSDPKYSQRWLYALGITMLCLEIFRISWRTYFYGWDLKNVRFDWCNQVCLIMPWLILLKREKAYPYIDVLSIIGGGMVLLFPLWVFYDYAGIHVMAVQSMVSHGLMVAIPLTMPFATGRAPSVKEGWKPLAGLCVMLLIAWCMSQYLDVNYLLMKGAEGLPVFGRIPYPWYWAVIMPIFVAGILHICFVLDKYNRRFVLRKNGKKNEDPCRILQ
jgi:uncharacterized membrane protein YwaF